jgi:hypothetical protein
MDEGVSWQKSCETLLQAALTDFPQPPQALCDPTTYRTWTARMQSKQPLWPGGG